MKDLSNGLKPQESTEGRCLKSKPCAKYPFGNALQAQGISKESPLLKTEKPLVFISSSMPKEALINLSRLAKAKGARLVMRGMVEGSMVKTAQFSKELGHAIDLDPVLFQKFTITKVPVFVIKTATGFKKLAGNVELNWAVEKLKGNS